MRYDHADIAKLAALADWLDNKGPIGDRVVGNVEASAWANGLRLLLAHDGTMQSQIEYLTGTPLPMGTINDYRDPEVDFAILRCRKRGDDETAQLLARMRLYFREQKDTYKDYIAAQPERLRAAIERQRELCAQAAYRWWEGEPEDAHDLREHVRAEPLHSENDNAR